MWIEDVNIYELMLQTSSATFQIPIANRQYFIDTGPAEDLRQLNNASFLLRLVEASRFVLGTGSVPLPNNRTGIVV